MLERINMFTLLVHKWPARTSVKHHLFSNFRTSQAEARALIGGGGAYSYIQVLPISV